MKETVVGTILNMDNIIEKTNSTSASSGESNSGTGVPVPMKIIPTNIMVAEMARSEFESGCMGIYSGRRRKSLKSVA